MACKDRDTGHVDQLFYNGDVSFRKGGILSRDIEVYDAVDVLAIAFVERQYH
jgi:hypothetical protein